MFIYDSTTNRRHPSEVYPMSHDQLLDADTRLLLVLFVTALSIGLMAGLTLTVASVIGMV